MNYPKSFYGWKGFLHYIKSYSSNYSKSYISQGKDQKLILYYQVQRLIRESCTTFGQKESRTSEFRYYFQEAKNLQDPQDVDHFLEIIKHIKQRLESGAYPPFPRLFPSIFSDDIKKSRLHHRKYMLNIERNDMILEPGQDPVRQPFMESKQFTSDFIMGKDYYQNVTEGTVFPDEELLFHKTKDIKKI